MMHPQLATVAQELSDATAQAEALARPLDEPRFRARPSPVKWSVGECLMHLNLSSIALLAKIDAALDRSPAADQDLSRRYRRDMLGWFLCRSLEPPARVARFTTIPSFVPVVGTGTKQQVLAEFARLQAEIKRRLDEASGRDLNHLKITSPFNERLSYNVYSAFRVVPVHQRRHLWQAEQVLASAAHGALA